MNDTDSKPSGTSANPAATVPAPDSSDRSERRRRALSRWLGAGLVIAVIVIVALAAALRHQQQQLDEFGREASRRLDEAASHAQLARQQAQLAQQTAQGLDRRLADVEARSRHTESQQQALEQAWNDLIIGEETSVLVDVEQSLLLAAEQLQLAGRVPSAIAALQVAEGRLARAGRPAYRPAQQAIARDLKRLQSLPYQDFNLVAEQIDRLIQDVARFPMVAPGLGDSRGVAPVPAPSSAPDQPAAPAGQDPTATEADWWHDAWQSSQAWAARTRDAAVAELRRLVEVRRVDTPDALMLSAEQAEILRANLALRLIEARMALLARANHLWLSDLEAVRHAVQRYGEATSPITRRVLTQLDELATVEPAPDLPNLNDSLRAVRALLAGIETEPVPGLPASPDEADDGRGTEPTPDGGAAVPESGPTARAPAVVSWLSSAGA